jgi:hypothetical protein
MKRHPSLFALSHHHQHVLVQAKKLGRVTDQVGEAKRLELARGFLTLWIPAGIQHFRQEEEILLPVMARYAGLDHPFFVRLSHEHLEIRSLIDSISDSLQSNQAPMAETLSRLGQLLDAHIRFEEHEVFPFAESLLPEEDLERIRSRMEEER